LDPNNLNCPVSKQEMSDWECVPNPHCEPKTRKPINFSWGEVDWDDWKMEFTCLTERNEHWEVLIGNVINPNDKDTSGDERIDRNEPTDGEDAMINGNREQILFYTRI
jgi:hypothetical protein